MDIVLERIRHPGIEQTDPALTLVLNPAFRAQQIVQQAAVQVVMRENHVAADVPGESALVADAARQSTHHGVALVEHPIVKPGRVQAEGRSQPGRTAAENHDPALIGSLHTGAPPVIPGSGKVLHDSVKRHER